MPIRKKLNVGFSFILFNFALLFVFITPSSHRFQTGTHSASVEKQQQLQSAAHTFYQQVVCVLKQRALVERERPGLSFSLVLNDTVMLSINLAYILT